jgi:glycosyltransferase involved in cell wall biosynthesis
MKALIVTPRFPWPPFTGDRLRATIWLSALAPNAEVALVSPRGTVPGDAPKFRFYPAAPSLTRCIQRAAAVILDRLPIQCLLAAPYEWSGAIAEARHESGPFDMTVVLLTRLHPWVRHSLEGSTILDAVDSLRRNAEERSKASPAAVRWLWKAEEGRMARVERDAAGMYDRVLVVSEEETSDLDRAMAVPNGVSTAPLDGAPRGFDFGFWGRLPYFANADAVAWILDEIWPAIRSLHPSATLVIGGADASRAQRNAARRGGVTLDSPIDDVAAFARNIRVALMPLRHGSGQSNKILEAAEAGCAIVGTAQALRGLAPLAPHTCIESTADGLARAAVDLLADDDRRSSLAAHLRDTVETHYDRSTTLDRLSAIAGVSREP